MGEYTYMRPCYFYSKFSLDEINQKFKEFIEKIKKEEDESDALYLEIYSFIKVKNGNNEKEYEIYPLDGEYYAKHYSSDRLAEFLTQIASKPVLLTFDSDYSGTYGYLAIPNGQVYEVDYMPTVNGKLLSEFLEPLGWKIEECLDD